MATVIRFPGPASAASVEFLSPEHRAFCLARQEMLRRWLAFVQRAPEGEMTVELESTANAMTQLQALEKQG